VLAPPPADIASAWETQCFVSAAVFGGGVIAVVSWSLARRPGEASTRRRVVMTVAAALLFVALLAVLFATTEPCAQGPA
jgi:hypothetical protein